MTVQTSEAHSLTRIACPLHWASELVSRCHAPQELCSVHGKAPQERLQRLIVGETFSAKPVAAMSLSVSIWPKWVG